MHIYTFIHNIYTYVCIYIYKYTYKHPKYRTTQAPRGAARIVASLASQAEALMGEDGGLNKEPYVMLYYVILY